jgi:hypothetical protein
VVMGSQGYFAVQPTQYNRFFRVLCGD